MKHIFRITGLICICFSFIANSQTTMTGDKFAKDNNFLNYTIAQSTNNNCFARDSRYFQSLTINIGNDNKPLNAYESFEDCVADGGKISSSERNRLVAAGELNLEDIEELAVKRNKVQEEEAKNKEEAEEEAKNQTAFAGINFGLGLAFTNVGNELIHDVEIVGAMAATDTTDAVKGTVQVNHSGSNRAMLMLESHIWIDFLDEANNVGWGPFIAIGVVGEEGVDPLSTYGGGIMVGKRIEGTARSWNVGLGWFIDTEAKVFRDDFENGSETDFTDPQDLLIKDESEGFMLMFSSTF